MNKKILFIILCFACLALLGAALAYYYPIVNDAESIDFRFLVVNISDTNYGVITAQICNLTIWKDGILELNTSLEVDAAGWHYYTYSNNTGGHRSCAVFCTEGKPMDCSFTINSTKVDSILDILSNETSILNSTEKDYLANASISGSTVTGLTPEQNSTLYDAFDVLTNETSILNSTEKEYLENASISGSVISGLNYDQNDTLYNTEALADQTNTTTYWIERTGCGN